MTPYKNLIFDLGEVIIDIDYRQTIAAFQQLAVVDFSEIVSYTAQNPVFDLYEKGKISTASFAAELKKFLRPGVTDEEVEHAWNAIFQQFPEGKIDLLLQLKGNYKTFALSNINDIHLATINRFASSSLGLPSFGHLFHGAYYSNLLGHRKPEKEIYQLILTNENLNPTETFFVDDKLENVEAARAFGIQAYHLTDRNKLPELLTGLHIIWAALKTYYYY